jgi:hypothetical protein
MILKLLSWLVIAISAALSVLLISVSTQIEWIGLTSIVFVLWIGITLLTKRTLQWSTLNYISTPIFLWSSTFIALLFTEAGLLQYILIGIATILSGLWLHTLNYTLHDKRWLIFRGNLISYINSYIIFFTTSSLYAAMVVVEFSFFIAVAILLPLVYLLFMHVMLASHLTWRFASFFAIISMILIAEVFAVLMVLPTSFWVKGLVVTISFYVVTGLSRCELTSIISPLLIRRYLIWGAILITAVLASAPWQ